MSGNNGYHLRTHPQRTKRFAFTSQSPYSIPKRNSAYPRTGLKAVPVVPQPVGDDQVNEMSTTEKMLGELMNKLNSVSSDLKTVKSQVENHTERFDALESDNQSVISENPVFITETGPGGQAEAGWQSVRDSTPMYHRPPQGGYPPLQHHQTPPPHPQQHFRVPPPRVHQIPQPYPAPRGGQPPAFRGGRGRGRFQNGGRGRQTRSFSENYDAGEQSGSHLQDQGQRRSSFSYDQKSELSYLIRQQMQNDQVHNEVIDHELIIDGLPYVDGDDWDTEVARATEKLLTVDKGFTPVDIENIHRFVTPTDDGARPMRVTLFSKLQAIHLTETARRAGFAWFRSSKSRSFRRHNANVPQRIKQKNARLPENSSMIWGERQVGRVMIHKWIPNPNYIPTGAATSSATTKTVVNLPIHNKNNPADKSTMGMES